MNITCLCSCYNNQKLLIRVIFNRAIVEKLLWRWKPATSCAGMAGHSSGYSYSLGSGRRLSPSKLGSSTHLPSPPLHYSPSRFLQIVPPKPKRSPRWLKAIEIKHSRSKLEHATTLFYAVLIRSIRELEIPRHKCYSYEVRQSNVEKHILEKIRHKN